MTPAELRRNVERTGSLFFTRNNMKFSGDTMANYGVRSVTVHSRRFDSGYIDCWELRRKEKTRHGLSGSAFFDKRTFEKVVVYEKDDILHYRRKPA